MAVAAPLAVEGIHLAKNIYQKPQFIKEKFLEVKGRIIKAYAPQEGESNDESIRRIAKNIFKTLACLSLMAAAGYLSAIILPSSIAISTAISSVFLIGKLFLFAGVYKEKIVEMFSKKLGEEPDVAKKRIIKNIIKTVLITSIAIALIAAATMVLTPFLTKGFSWSVSIPFQTKGVVFAEYTFLGLVHGYLAYSKFKKGDRSGGLFHLVNAVLSIVFPIFYLNHEMRLHHSFYGLLMTALPFRATKFLGSLITFDSSLYMLEPVRGYATVNAWGLPKFESYDFINSIVDHFPLFYNTYSTSLIAQNINQQWAKHYSDEKGRETQQLLKETKKSEQQIEGLKDLQNKEKKLTEAIAITLNSEERPLITTCSNLGSNPIQ